RALWRCGESQEVSRGQVLQQTRVGVGFGVVELVDDDDVEAVRLQPCHGITGMQGLNRREHVPPLPRTFACDVLFTERAVAQHLAELGTRLFEDLPAMR